MHASSFSEDSSFELSEDEELILPSSLGKFLSRGEASSGSPVRDLVAAFERFVRQASGPAGKTSASPKKKGKTSNARAKRPSFESLLKKWVQRRRSIGGVLDPYDPELSYPSERFREKLREGYERAFQ